MALDLTKAREKAQEEEAKSNRGNFQSLIWWKPAQGKNLIRLMPPWSDDPANPNANQFWREVYMHFKVGPNGWSGSCPATTPFGPGGVCPVCQEVERLRGTGNPADSELAKDIRAKQRVYSNIVDLGDPVYTAEDFAEWKNDPYNKEKAEKDCSFTVGQTKVKVFSYGPQIFKQFLDIVTETVDITDLTSGYDLLISRTGKGRDTSYNVQIMPPAKPFVPVGVKEVGEALIDLDNILQFQDLANLEAAVTGVPAPAAVGGATKPPAALGAGSQAAEPPPAAAEPPPAAAEPPPAAAEPEVAEEEEAPECFGDKEVHSTSDAECIGGTVDMDGDLVSFDPCPFFKDCAAKCNPPKPKPKSRRKAAKKKPANTAVDQLEQEMNEAIK